MKKSVLPKREWASYQIAMRCWKYLSKRGHISTRYESEAELSKDILRDLAKEIRAFRAEDRKTN